MKTFRKKSIGLFYYPGSMFLFILTLTLSSVYSSKVKAGFIYDAINEPIISATFNGDFAELGAHRFIGGFEVNMIKLIDPQGNLPDLDLSDDFFGTSELLLGDLPAINQGQLETGIISAAIPDSFFPILETGAVGLWFLATDTDDGLFAIDFLSLTIETTNGVVETLLHDTTNDGFGIGLSDGGILLDPLPISISIGATGTGFNEAISSKAIHWVPVSEPSTFSLLIITGILLSYSSRNSRLATLKVFLRS